MHTTIDFTPDVRYAYATGRVRVLETKLLSTSRVDKMIESETVSDALVYLEDTAYDDTIGDMTNPENYEELVEREKRSAFELMDRLIIDEEIRHLFRIPYDFHNAKLLLKRRLSGIETPITLSEFGTIPRDVIQDAFDTENFNPLPEFMREAVGQAMAHHYLKKDLKSMEFIIDNLEYGALRTLVQKISIPFLSAFVAAKIDLTNIATFLRIKYFETQDSVVEAIIEGGTLDFLFFMKLMGETFESVAALFRNSPYHEIVDLGTRKILESGSFSALDRETENYLMRFMKHTRYITFGAEPLFAYFAAREQDLNIIKMILVGKLNELSKDDMRERLPITYNQ